MVRSFNYKGLEVRSEIKSFRIHFQQRSMTSSFKRILSKVVLSKINPFKFNYVKD